MLMLASTYFCIVIVLLFYAVIKDFDLFTSLVFIAKYNATFTDSFCAFWTSVSRLFIHL